MTGKLIRCLCGNMYDPARYQACPECGRPAVKQPSPKLNDAPQPSPAPADQPPAARPTAGIPGWAWKACAIAAGILVVTYFLARSGQDAGITTSIDQAREDQTTQGVIDPGLVGTWEQEVPNEKGVATWIFQIARDGSYSFTSTGPGGPPPSSGNFTGKNGVWSLKSTTIDWDDAGTYNLPTPDTFVMTGKLGTGVWKRK